MTESERQIYRSVLKSITRMANDKAFISKKSASFRAAYWRTLCLGMGQVCRKALDDGNNMRKVLP